MRSAMKIIFGIPRSGRTSSVIEANPIRPRKSAVHAERQMMIETWENLPDLLQLTYQRRAGEADSLLSRRFIRDYVVARTSESILKEHPINGIEDSESFMDLMIHRLASSNRISASKPYKERIVVSPDSDVLRFRYKTQEGIEPLFPIGEVRSLWMGSLMFICFILKQQGECDDH